MVTDRALHDLPLGHLSACQICGSSSDLELVLDLGYHAPCDSLLRPEDLLEPEATYPLRFLRCRRCGLAQIDYVVPPAVLFHREYPYRSGITPSLTQGLARTAETVIETNHLPAGSLVVDIGSNDGTLLSAFKARGMRVLGVEPTNVAKIAIANGIPTLQEFFSEETAERILTMHGEVSAVVATNMFAHIPNLGELIEGVKKLIPAEGLFVTESHYLLDLLETVQYDTIYHEHLKFYGLKPLLQLFDQHDFSIVDAERIPNYGGSIRVVAKRGRGRTASSRLSGLIDGEQKAHLYEPETYQRFVARVTRSKLDLVSLLVDLRRRGEHVVGIGAPGRASTLLQFCGIGPDVLPYLAEQNNSLKLGLFLPAQHIPVVDEKTMFDEQPTHALMLSWHYAEPIMKKLRLKGLRAKFIVPLPDARIVEDI